MRRGSSGFASRVQSIVTIARIDPEATAATVLLILVASVTIGPVLFLHTLPLVDWPNHLARLYALGARDSDPIRQSFVPHWALMPDLGCDLVYSALKSILSPETALRFCLGGSLLVICLAVWRIQFLLFRTITYAVSIMPLAATGLSVGMGYVNFVMGIGVVLAALAMYLSWRSSLSTRRVLTLSVLATLSWIAHLASFSVFAFVLGVMLVGARPRSSHTGHAPSSAVRAGCFYLAVIGPGILFSAFAEKQSAAFTLGYGNGVQKLRFLLAPFLATGDASNIGVVALFVAGLLLVGRLGFLAFSPVTRTALWLFGGLIVVLPWQVGNAIDVDARLVLPFTALALASTRLQLPRRMLPHAACVVPVLLASALHLHIIAAAARLTDTEQAIFRRTAARLPVGSAMMVATDNAGACRPAGPSTLPLLHLASYAVIDRGAYAPTIFIAPGMQPLRAAREPFDAGARPIMPPSLELLSAIADAGGVQNLLRLQSNNPTLRHELRALVRTGTGFLDRWPASYDSLLVLHGRCARNAVPWRLASLGGDAFFTLYKMRKEPLPAE